MSVFRLFFFVHTFCSECDADGADVLHLRPGTVPLPESLQGSDYGVDAPGKKGRNKASSTAARCLSVSSRQDIRSRMSARFQKFFRLFIVPRF